MNQSMNSNDRSALLHKLRAEDFALYEVALYLDAHPGNKKALKYYHEHKRITDMLRAEFEEKFGPLTLYNNQSENNWEWVEGPWPWEKEAN
ncbi:MAG: spore coat protein CotJB [Clostridia bacterium]|nr:spore coat protein CotJB [Clostridia bacterium]